MEVPPALHDGKRLLLQRLTYRRVRVLVQYPTDSRPETLHGPRTRGRAGDKAPSRRAGVCVGVHLPQPLRDTRARRIIQVYSNRVRMALGSNGSLIFAQEE